MNAKILSALTVLFVSLTAIAQLDFSGVLSVMPELNSGLIRNLSAIVTTLLVITRAIGDFVDDGKINDSFGKVKCASYIFFVAFVIAVLALIGCSGVAVDAQTPWGRVTSANGQTTIQPLPIVIPGK